MRVIDSSAEVLLQGPGVVGMFKQIERAGRISYKSEDRITPDSYTKFINMLKERGHWSVFEHGTVYLTIPKHEPEAMIFLESEENKINYNRFVDKGEVLLVTTNYRYILQNGLEGLLDKYWTEPTEHYRRVTAHIVCSRLVSHQLVRHRAFSHIQESQRYVNYSREKYGAGITFIIPQWAYAIRRKLGSTVDPQTYEPRDYLLNITGEDLWNELCKFDKKVASRDRFWQTCEDEYMYDISEEDGGALNPEDARGCLCNDTKTELCITGYLQDWITRPNEQETPEKYGFFYLRSANSAQRDIRVLSTELEKRFKELGFYELK